MQFALTASLLAGGLFLAMLLCMALGRRIARRRPSADLEAARAGAGVVDGAVLALLGLLIAFTFSGAASRFDARRALIVEEANAIGTAYLRVDLLPASAQGAVRESFRRYLDARLAAYRAFPDVHAVKAHWASAARLQREIWTQAVSAVTGSQAATMLLLPALNAMIDITTTRAMAAQSHPPLVVFVLLFALALISALLAGYAVAAARKTDWTHMGAFSFALAVAVYVILDLEYPRLGMIRIDGFDQVLVELRQSME